MRYRIRHTGRLLRTFAAARRGAVAVIIALVMPVILGSMALGVEVSLWYVQTQRLQTAVDAAAYAAAVERKSMGDNLTLSQKNEIRDVAHDAARQNGFEDPDPDKTGDDPDIEVLIDDYQDNDDDGDNDASGYDDDGESDEDEDCDADAEDDEDGDEDSDGDGDEACGADTWEVAVVGRSLIPLLFLQPFSRVMPDDMVADIGDTRQRELVAMGVARVGTEIIEDDACILALSENDKSAVDIGGSADINLEGCQIASNANTSPAIDVRGNARGNVDCLSAVGSIDNRDKHATKGLTLDCDAPRENQPSTQDPYSDLPVYDEEGDGDEDGDGDDSEIEPAACQSPDNTSKLQNTTVDPGADGEKCFSANHLHVKGDVTFLPGTYYFQGKVTFNANATVDGSGVSFVFLGGGALTINGKAQLNLSAPTSGTYSGVLFYGEDPAGQTHKINGNSSSTFTGAMYFPEDDIRINGGSDTGGTNSCLQIIGKTVDITGAADLSSQGCGAGGAGGGLAHLRRTSVRLTNTQLSP